MEMFALRQMDYDFIDKIIKKAKEIENKYISLCNIECCNCKNSVEYLKTINDLKELMRQEDFLYENYNIDFLKCIAISDYIAKKYFSKDYMTDIESIIEQCYSDAHIRRVLNNIVYRMTFSKKNIDNIFPPEIVNFLRNVGINDKDEFIIESNQKNEIKLMLNEDYINSFLNILNSYIYNTEYGDAKKILLFGKYYTIFINTCIEKNLIKTNFDVSDKLYINSKFFSELRMVKSNVYNKTKNDYNYRNAKALIKMLISMEDFEYEYIQVEAESIFLQTFLRASFIMLDIKYIDGLKAMFTSLIDDDNYLSELLDNSISKEIIDDCFQKVSKDKSRPYILSLTPKK